ncbi:hypothetical protein ACG33_09470 [Steroidobacter denitrificans]|uniref:Xcc1710-like domain-containing protein n=1 Tax=Steroidobacter denitrificans TaxID=465721 RepID=A0A127FCL7_STEDE|nr:Mth938-like domain-containing protein [Steroidobacter denitrificans]AMN47319.1 hypothetical protein ACG33_09470 [Steroidobacter denitrificans]
MKLTDDGITGANLVHSYARGQVRVAGEVIRGSCLISRDRLVRAWRPRSIAQLTEEDFEAVLALEPEIVVLGSGADQQFPDSRLLATLMSRGIGCEVMETGAACRTYNVLVSEDRRVVAALLLEDDEES